MNSAAVALGCNLGHREAVLASAVARIGEFLHDLRVSHFYDTAPVGVAPQPNFLNAAVSGNTSLAPRAFLEQLLRIEREHGRQRPHPGAARTLDLDLILFGTEMIDEPGLHVPHPRFRDRLFVLEPLAEVAADWIDPLTGLTVDALLAARKAAP